MNAKVRAEMGECGCTLNDAKYYLRGPDRTIYVVTLSGHCANCDAPAGVSIEAIEPHHVLYHECLRGEFTQGPLPFTDWPDSRGVAIVTGMTKSQFVKAVSSHLVGINSNEIGDENAQLDECAAEIVAEEMYRDAQRRPSLVSPCGVKHGPPQQPPPSQPIFG
jgi:hypothetical protein